jgi:rRNA-processing protein FCF1
VFWRIEDASDHIKDAEFVVKLHKKLRAELEALLPDTEFIGYVMDSTATNRKAMTHLREADPTIVVLDCIAHALSNLMKHTAEFFAWVDSVYECSCALSEKLIKNEKMRSAVHELQEAEYGSKCGICAHVPARFGSRHMVLRDIMRSEMALRKLAAGAARKAALTDSAPLKRVHEQIFAADDDLFDMDRKVEELLGPVMDYMHQIEADQPMLSFVSGAWDDFLRMRTNFKQTIQS